MAASLHPILGLGQPRALVRRRRDSRMRGLVVGKFLVNFQPGCGHAGRWRFLVHGYRLEAVDGPLSRGWDGIYVGCARTNMGAAALELSHRSSPGPALGHAYNRLRPPRSRLAGRDCRRSFHRLAILAARPQHELRLSGSAIPSRLGACSLAPRRDFRWSSCASLLAHSSFT